MPRRKSTVPQYLLHAASGQARVRVDGRDVYLGKFNSPESKAKYSKLLAEQFADRRPTASRPDPTSAATPLTIAQLVVEYDDYAGRVFVRDGERTDERYKAIVEPLVLLYGGERADQFGPLKLKAVRELLIQRGSLRTAEFDGAGNFIKPGTPLCREYVNNVIKALLRMFRWAASEEKVPASVCDALATVEGLKKGRDRRLREPAKVRPAPDEDIWAVVAVCPPQIAAMIQLQYWTGARPDEITILRPCDVDRTGPVWSYVPHRHKLEYHELGREILLGPQAQQVLEPWLAGRAETEYVFSPREAAEANAQALQRRCKKANSRKVPVSQKRPPRQRYDDASYRQAVVRACQRAGVPRWTPGQLRHNAATRIWAEHGPEAAQLVLGHANLSTTEIYAERDRARYVKIMSQAG